METPEPPEAREANFEIKEEKPVIEKFEETTIAPTERIKLQAEAVAAAKEAGIEINDADIEAKKEKIISKLVEAILAAGEGDGAEGEIKKIMEKAMAYTGKGYPMIADAVHDRILEARNQGMH